MSMQDQSPLGQGTSSVTDAVTQLNLIARQLGLWVLAFNGRVTQGSFTMAASATTVVPQPAVKATSNITLTPKGASAGTLVGSAKSPYISAISPGVSFTVATANGVAAAGTEAFQYQITSTS